MRGESGREGRKEWRGKGEYASLALGRWTPLIMITNAAENGVARPKRPLPVLIGQEAQLAYRDRASILSVEIM